MELTGAILGEFKDRNPHVNFQDYETLQPFFAYEEMFKDASASAAPTFEAAPVDATSSDTLPNVESSPQEDPSVLLLPLEGDPNYQ